LKVILIILLLLIVLLLLQLLLLLLCVIRAQVNFILVCIIISWILNLVNNLFSILWDLNISRGNIIISIIIVVKKSVGCSSKIEPNFLTCLVICINILHLVIWCQRFFHWSLHLFFEFFKLHRDTILFNIGFGCNELLQIFNIDYSLVSILQLKRGNFSESILAWGSLWVKGVT